MSDPLSLSVDRENSLQDFDEFLGVEREEIDFARITDEQLDQYVGDGVTVVTNSVAGRMSEGYFMPIDDPTTAAVDGDDPAAAVDGAVNDTDGAEGITAEDPLPKMKRSRFSFAKRKVLAGSGMFSSNGLPIDGISGCMIGVILQCPRQQNQHRFYID
jgi:hypothetical protein